MRHAEPKHRIRPGPASIEPLEPRLLLSVAAGLAPDAAIAALTGEGNALATVSAPAKVDGDLWQTVQSLTADPSTGGGVLGSAARVTADGRIETYIHVTGDPGTRVDDVESLGIVVDTRNDSMGVIQAWVPAGLVTSLAQLPWVTEVSLPVYAVTNTGSVTSAGDSILRADQVRSRFAAYGIDGAGIKIGVISDGADSRALVQATGDLPATVGVDPSRPGSGNEGTAMMEIVHDLAPGAQLYFSGPNTSADMVDSINWLVAQGCTVIVDDLTFFDQPFFEDGAIAQTVDAVVAGGVTYVTSSGNYSNAHYQGAYAPYSATTYQTFYVNTTTPTDLLLFPAATGNINGVVEWSDAWGASGNDYDLYLFGWSGSSWTEVASSTNVQSGTQDPFEYISYDNTTYSEMGWVVDDYSGAARELEMFFYGGGVAGYYSNVTYTTTDVIIEHAAVASVITVGAIDASDPGNDTVESYSSRGPSTIYTNFTTQAKIQRQTLDGCGIDGVQTKVGQPGYGGWGNPFYGTSAAAPHVAALAALIRQANPSLTPAQVASILDGTAVDLTAYGTGYDNTSGYGRFDGLGAVYEAFTPGAPTLDAASDLGKYNNDRVTSDNTPTFTGAAPADSCVHLYVDGVETGSQQLTGAQTSYSVTSSALADGVHSVTIRVAENSSVPTANLSYSSSSLSITIDKTAPTLVWGTPTPANGAGWNNTNVSIPYTPADALSGVDTSLPASPLVITTEGSSVTGQVTVTDIAGNTAIFTSAAFKIDKTAPTLVWGTATPANGAGWNNTDVSIPYTPGDGLSGVNTSLPASPLVLTTEGTSVTGQVTVTDIAGNTAIFTSAAFKIDKTAPTLVWGTPTPANGAGWNNTNVSIPYTPGDGLSGVNTSLPASPLVLTTEGSAVTGQVTVTDIAGNTAIFTSAAFKIDKTAPTLAWGTATAANGAGWNNTNVSIPYTPADSLSGVNTSLPPSPLVLTTEGSAVTGQVTVTDIAGNTAIFTSAAFRIDKTAPTLVWGTPTPANGAGWNNTNVSIPYTPSDGLSGVNTSLPASPLVLTTEGSSVTGQVTVTDIAGNTAIFTSAALKIDKTAPTLAWGTPTPANGAGWNNTNVSIPYTPSDGLSGVTTSLPASPLVLTTEGSAVTGQVTVTDIAGNTAIFTSAAFKIDKTAPTLVWGTPTPANGAGWNDTNVSIPYTPSDGLSGVNTSLPASPLVITTEGSSVTGQVTVTDIAGNTATFTSATFKIDKTAPTLIWGSPTPANGAGWNNTNVSIPYTPSDGLSGVNTSLPASPLVLTTEGSAVTGQVTVTDIAGNTAIFTSAAFKIDKTAPTLVWGTATPANGAGWNNTNVSIPYTPGDGLSGVNTSLPASPLVLTTEGSAVTGQVTVTDIAGNTAIFTSAAFKIDKTAPTSSVLALPAIEEVVTFAVGWSGADGSGSGIAAYDVYVSDNGGTFGLWQNHTAAASAQFTGVDGHIFSFYSIAVDSAGNAEIAPSQADAAATVDVPVALAYGQPPLDGFVGMAIVPSVTVSVMDARGHVVAVDTSSVTLVVASGPGTLGGTTTVAAVNGVATFGNFWATAAGSYRLRASDGSLTTASSSTFTVAVFGPDSHELNNFSWLPTPVALDGNGSASLTLLTIASADEDDWFSFTAPYGTTGALQVSVANVGGGLTPELSLYDSPAGSLSDLYGGVYTTLFGPKAVVDASGANQAVTIHWSGLQGGTTYYLEAEGLANSTGFYTLNVACAMLPPDALEPNDTSAAATNITSALVSGVGITSETNLSISRLGDEDWFRIDTPANADGNLTATVSHLSGGLQGLVWVYQHYSWGDVPVAVGVYASWMPGGAGQAIAYNVQPNTTYFVRVDNFYSETGAYQLDVTLPLDQQARDAYETGVANNASWFASPLTLSGGAATVNGLTIQSWADQDWFRFMPTANGNVTITVSGVSGGLKTHIGLYDSVLGSLADQYGGIYTTLFGPKQVSDTTTANQTVTLTFTGLHAYTTYYVKVSGDELTTGLYTLGLVLS